jgi:hypothetical protein
LIEIIAVIKAIKIAKSAFCVTTWLSMIIISEIGTNEDSKIVGIDSNIENFAASTLEIL